MCSYVIFSEVYDLENEVKSKRCPLQLLKSILVIFLKFSRVRRNQLNLWKLIFLWKLESSILTNIAEH